MPAQRQGIWEARTLQISVKSQCFFLGFKVPVNVTVNGASVCPFQCSAWTAALWSAPPFSRLCAPWIATKLKSDSRRMVAALCQQGWFVIGLSSFLLSCVLASWKAQFQACSSLSPSIRKKKSLNCCYDLVCTCVVPQVQAKCHQVKSLILTDSSCWGAVHLCRPKTIQTNVALSL